MDILHLPAQNHIQQEQCESLKTLIDKQQIIRPNLFQLRIGTPSSNGHLEFLLHDIYKPGTFQIFLDPMVFVLSERLAHLVARLEHQPGPLLEDVIRVVVHAEGLAARGDVVGYHLDVARPGHCVLERAGVQERPVHDGGFKAADVDQVELLGWREGPFALDVVDLERHVGGNPGGLDGRDVYS